MDNFRCKICEVDVSGERNYQQHLEGKAHAKMKVRMGHSNPPTSGNSATSLPSITATYLKRSFELEPWELHAGNELFCEICKVHLTGSEPAAQHYAGAKHKKKADQAVNFSSIVSERQQNSQEKPHSYDIQSIFASKLKLIERQRNICSEKSDSEVDSAPSEDIQLSADDESSCKICQVSFTGREPAVQHYTGTKHKKKAETVRLASINRLPGVYCEVCHIMCNTHQQLHIHKQSTRHLEKANGLSGELDTQQISTDIDEGISFDYTEESCDLCGISTFTSQQHLQDHFSGKRHKQNAARQKLLGSLPAEKYCEHCKVFLTSEQQAADHLSSPKHKSNEAKGRKAPEKSLPPITVEEDVKFDGALTCKSPRSYQWELYNKAIETDSVIFLPTGTGKTLISAMVISHVLQQNPKRQIVFLVDRVLLVIQQSQVLKTELSHLSISDQSVHIAALCGEKQNTGSLPLHEHHILVTTAAYYINLLKDDVIRWEDLSLVVFDEAHHCTKKHPFNVILEDYYSEGEHKPRLLGLTASPAGQQTVKKTYLMLQQLLLNFGGAKLATVQKTKDELLRFKTQAEPVIRVVKWDRHENILDEELQMYLLNCYQVLRKQAGSLSMFVDLDGVSEISSENLIEFVRAVDQLKSLYRPEDTLYQFLNHIFAIGEVLETLRETGLEFAIADLKEVFKRDLKLAHRMKILLSSGLQKLLGEYVKGSNEMSGVHQLLNELGDHMNWSNGIALVLVKMRRTAHAITEFLNKSSLVQDKHCEAVCLVGHGTGGKDGGGMSVNKQGRTIRRIWENKSVIVVATSVAEEGLDLPECDLVIVMDPPSTVTALVQIRGRARRSGAKFIVLCRGSGQRDSMHELLLREKNMEEAAEMVNKETSPRDLAFME